MEYILLALLLIVLVLLLMLLLRPQQKIDTQMITDSVAKDQSQLRQEINSNLMSQIGTLSQTLNAAQESASKAQRENLKDIIIHNGVVKIWHDAFYGCHSLKSVRIPSSVTSIDYEAFDWCTGLTEFIVDDANQNYADIDGILYNKDISIMVICPYGYVTDNLVIPSTVTGFMGGFKGHRHITGKVTIPGSVKNIGGELFMNTYITEVLIEEGVTQIGYDAFCGTKLKKVTIPSTLSPWGGIQEGAFRANPSLSEIYYYGSPRQIYTNVFYNIASSCKLYIPKGAILFQKVCLL